MAARSGPMNPIGTGTDIKLMCHHTSADPGFNFIAVPIARLAREILLISGKQVDKPGDFIQGKEMAEVWRIIIGMEDCRRGPIRAMRAALSAIGWELVSPTISKPVKA